MSDYHLPIRCATVDSCLVLRAGPVALDMLSRNFTDSEALTHLNFDLATERVIAAMTINNPQSAKSLSKMFFADSDKITPLLKFVLED